jgi:hypothetical protein
MEVIEVARTQSRIASLLRTIAKWEAYRDRCEASQNWFEAECTEMHIADLRAELRAEEGAL